MRENLFNREDMAKAWQGFKAGNWSEEIDVETLSRRTTNLTMVTRAFWKGQASGLPNFGKELIS